jgi:hypothetical protein
MTTVDDGAPPGAGSGEIGDGEELPPQANANIRIVGTRARRHDNIEILRAGLEVKR